MKVFSDTLVLIRGAGDLATGAAARLWRAGFPVVMTELAVPLMVRRTVALGEAVRAGEVQVEELIARRAGTVAESATFLADGIIPVLIDPRGETIPILAPTVVIDARMAKRNLDTSLDDAPLVIGLGPGFTAGQDVHAVIETNRGHYLGRVLWRGSAEPNTGTPGLVAGRGAERALRAPAAGRVVAARQLGARVEAGEVVATLVPEGDGPVAPIPAPFNGVLRGLIADDVLVPAGLKIGDVDPRAVPEHCFTISDKALAIGGGALEAILSWLNRRVE